MIDTIIANKFGVSTKRIINCFDIFNQLVFYEFTTTDKILLNKLLNNVKDDLNYEYSLQKFYVYMIIFFSNFISEGIIINLDHVYTNIVIKVLFNTNIVQELFKLL